MSPPFFLLLWAVPPSPSMCEGWLDCSHVCLAQWPHRNCGAVVGSGGKQGGEGEGEGDIENDSHTLKWLTRWFVELCESKEKLGVHTCADIISTKHIHIS